MNIFKKLATTKSTAQSLGLIWVLFSRHILERVFERPAGGLFLPVFISCTDAVQRWLARKMLKERESTRGQVSYSLCSLSGLCTDNSMVANLALCGWLPDFKYSAALTPRALTDCLLHFGTPRWWVSDPLNKKPEHHMVIFKKCYLKIQRLYEEHSYVTPLTVWSQSLLLFPLLETAFQSVSHHRSIVTDS